MSPIQRGVTGHNLVALLEHRLDSLVGIPGGDQVPVSVREDLVVEYYSTYM